MHAWRKLVQLTTAASGLLLASCGASSVDLTDAGCASQACSQSPECPSLTCIVTLGVGSGDGGGEQTKTQTISGECTSGCCAGCPGSP